MINFAPRGVHDNKPTPKLLYEIITQDLKFVDVCVDKTKFDAVSQLWGDRSYCNPPFSIKKPFVLKAIESNKAGSEVLLYSPFDPRPSWFKLLYQQNVLVMVFMKRFGHERFAHALYHLKNHAEAKVMLVEDEHAITRVLNNDS